jgi:TonB family protein
MLNFGNGDGTGMSKGNLSEEGMMHKGKAPGNELEDASTAAKTRVVKNFSPDDPTSTSNLVPKNILPSSEKTKEQENGSGTTNTGSNLGSLTGTGLGDKGFGPGKGTGFGDIEWGGGGNRTVLQKSLPKYPQGTRYAAQIKIKFTVASDGTVTTMIPLQKGDPTLEKAAMNALRQWRFNPLAQKKDMIGIITFTFKLG